MEIQYVIWRVESFYCNLSKTIYEVDSTGLINYSHVGLGHK